MRIISEDQSGQISYDEFIGQLFVGDEAQYAATEDDEANGNSTELCSNGFLDEEGKVELQASAKTEVENKDKDGNEDEVELREKKDPVFLQKTFSEM